MRKHWAETIALELISENSKNPIILQTGVGPSGTVHIGKLRDVLMTFFVKSWVEKYNKQAKIVFSWDDFDTLKKIPKSLSVVEKEILKEEIGKPYSLVRDTRTCHKSYAEHFEEIFQDELLSLGVKIDEFIYQSNEYLVNSYKDAIKLILDNRKAIFNIIQTYKTHKAADEESNNYYPITIYCEVCNKQTTKISNFNNKDYSIEYYCECGNSSEIFVDTTDKIKIPFNVEWPMRWKHEGVMFEPIGKDHASPLGVYNVSSDISKKIFNYNPPKYKVYEFLGIKGVKGKMSVSNGRSITLSELLKVYPKEIILWQYYSKDPSKYMELDFYSEVPQVYNDFFKLLRGSKINQNLTLRTSYFSEFKELFVRREFNDEINFNILVLIISVCEEGDLQKLAEICNLMDLKIDMSFLNDLLKKVAFWITNYSPETRIIFFSNCNSRFINGLSEVHKEWLQKLYLLLKNSTDNYNVMIQNIYNVTYNEGNTLSKKSFYKFLYNVLINRDSGPPIELLLRLKREEIIQALEPYVAKEISV
ncbi:lysine--tRNA ligase [Bacillus thuringiensis]|uniref:lysine--tRNA ligase n=1 Tax=Bacillus thuringiensis TaxID=1428 RepID=UPI000BF2CD6D|nr:lysine--tRNA ligase [Bacillus thuringiensis]PFJ10033.1 lysine--tRNA ligase [Bacillus thuringiensis]PGX85643.1 lysine--tRNA ligase [Bacillus thuringiensis]HDR8064190.1 lysine--tRNA ligase [Bacillus cereus]